MTRPAVKQRRRLRCSRRVIGPLPRSDERWEGKLVQQSDRGVINLERMTRESVHSGWFLERFASYEQRESWVTLSALLILIVDIGIHRGFVVTQ